MTMAGVAGLVLAVFLFACLMTGMVLFLRGETDEED